MELITCAADAIKLAEGTEWQQKMAETNQDSFYHQEGDTWTHTKMVLSAMSQDISWQSSEAETKNILMYSALLHDVAKPETTQEVDGRIISPNHAKLGVRKARLLLEEWGASFHTREAICRLIRAHTIPPHAWDEGVNLSDQLIKLSCVCNLEWLGILVKADLTGRRCNDQTKMLTDLQLWESAVEEIGVQNKAYPFSSNKARVLWFKGESTYPDYQPYPQKSSHVTMMAGLPGAGKDTWIRDHWNVENDGPIVSLDQLREEGNPTQVIQVGREVCKQYLRQKQNFCFNATNITRDLRKQWLDIFHSYGAQVKIVYVEPGLKKVIEQNSQRERCVPKDVIHRLFWKLDVPDLTEAEQVQYYV